MWTRWRPFPERLAGFIEIEARLLEVPDDALGELLPGIVRRMLPYGPAQQVAAPRDREADGKGELVAEACA